MSDMSLPPHPHALREGRAGASPRDPQPDGPFAWPTPELPCYPAPKPLPQDTRCEIEGLNGKMIQGALASFSPAEGLLRVAVPSSRQSIELRFSQFRWLRLIDPLTILRTAGSDTAATIAGLHPPVPYHVELAGSPTREGRTRGALETDAGLFLFEPLDAWGNVQRVFVPRHAYARSEVGQRIGQVLVEERLVTQGQVQAALAKQDQLRHRKLGEILLTGQILTPEELVEAIEQQARMPMVRIGEALVALGLITPAQLDDALQRQREDRGVPLGELLVRHGAVSHQDLRTALARKMGYPLVDLTQFPVESDAVARIPHALASRLLALPLMQRAGRLVVAVEDPSRAHAIDEIEFAAQGKVVPVLARASVLPGIIEQEYRKLGAEAAGNRFAGDAVADFAVHDTSKLLESLEANQSGDGDDEGLIEQSDNSLVRLINTMILEARASGVSDIHVECAPGREKVRIRFRRDGVLRPYLELPHTYRAALIARLKIMCDLDISERRKPQDGKIAFSRFVPGQRLELRLATIPTFGGLEDAVLRLLSSARPLPLDQLGLDPRHLERLRQIVHRPHGLMLCVGPTGSGKTTTLHSAMSEINRPERKIWTAEDPIEITQPGLRQVQVNPKIDWTFAKALRAFLRADPDVIMVGEIRDRETAQTAIEASLTGHLVLSTLHTNSAPETVTRLLDMGMDPFNFADALLGVLAQRLVRRVCTHCRRGHAATPGELDEMVHDHLRAMQGAEAVPAADDVLGGWMKRFGTEGRITLYRAAGCEKCEGTGFLGRAAIHELMTASPALRQMIQTGARSDEIKHHAIRDGMLTLRQDGIEKVLQGLTTLEEVRASSN